MSEKTTSSRYAIQLPLDNMLNKESVKYYTGKMASSSFEDAQTYSSVPEADAERATLNNLWRANARIVRIVTSTETKKFVAECV